VQKVGSNNIAYRSNGVDYELRLSGTCQQLPDGAIRILPDSSGKLVLTLGGF
jgi:hypothetical protein